MKSKKSEFEVNIGFITQKLDKKTTILDTEKSVLYTLNQTAVYYFNKLKSGKSRMEIITAAAKKYDIPMSQAAEDFDDLLTVLKEKGIIKEKVE